jgi:DNA-binding XRE family transcriptional regulator
MEVEARAIGLRRMRLSRGLTTQLLADKLGLTLKNLESLELGAAKPSPQLRRALMAYFDCHFEDLFEVVSVQMEESP